MSLSYYIYYQMPRENAERARSVVTSIQRELHTATGIAGRLLSRHDDETTWMEIYEDVLDTATFDAMLSKLVTRHGLAQMLEAGSSRKQEIFRPI